MRILSILVALAIASGIADANDAVEWEFSLDENTEAEKLTLMRNAKAPPVDAASAHRFRSVNPVGDRGPRGYTYLRFQLSSYQFANVANAEIAFGEVFPPGHDAPTTHC